MTGLLHTPFARSEPALIAYAVAFLALPLFVPAAGFWVRRRSSSKGETLVVSKVDRLRRDAIDVLQTVRQLGERDVKVVVLQLGSTDLTAPTGKLLLSVLAAVAEMERDMLVERTQAGLARAKAEGKTLGSPSKTTPDDRLEIRRRLM